MIARVSRRHSPFFIQKFVKKRELKKIAIFGTIVEENSSIVASRCLIVAEDFIPRAS